LHNIQNNSETSSRKYQLRQIHNIHSLARHPVHIRGGANFGAALTCNRVPLFFYLCLYIMHCGCHCLGYGLRWLLLYCFGSMLLPYCCNGLRGCYAAVVGLFRQRLVVVWRKRAWGIVGGGIGSGDCLRKLGNILRIKNRKMAEYLVAKPHLRKFT